jgi:acyl-CoA thioester hydrolase
MLRRMLETRVQLRWGDFDALGHLTHVAYPVILDEGRDAFFRGTVGPFEEFPWVIAHLSLDHRREIRHPASEVVVRTRVTKVGTSSVSLEQDVIAPDGATAATSSSVLVAWDGEARTKRALTDEERARLS